MARTKAEKPKTVEIVEISASYLPRLIWTNIRKMQYLKNIADEKLAIDLEVTQRTLSNYDRDPGTIKLESIEKFCIKENIELIELIS